MLVVVGVFVVLVLVVVMIGAVNLLVFGVLDRSPTVIIRQRAYSY